ncbi:MAG: double-strand break repair helicase AddA [Methyloceanibacter sp.]
MNETAPLPHEPDSNQARASDPVASAWVSANAGTGKTTVLVRRCLRLLLADSQPEAILCLTYTKTAAAQMQNKLLEALSAWAILPEDKLSAALAKLTGREPEPANLRKARRLFARVLEARGGLKIHTIHGFCERLLQRFPLEAQVTPQFAVLDEREAALLRAEAFDAAMARAAEERDSALGQALAKIIALASERWFRQIVEAVLAKRAELARMAAFHGGHDAWPADEANALKVLFGVAERAEADLIAEMGSVLADTEIDALLVALQAHGCTKDDARVEAALRSARAAPGETRASLLKTVFCTDDNKPRARVCGSAVRDAAPALCAALVTAQARFVELDAKLAALRAAEASGAVLALADEIQSGYERRKRAKAALDYDDLIVKSLHLLSRAGAAEWVLFKIDGGIEHILVDEAQDTNPDQWSIIERLAEEFFGGAGARETLRTLFAVGDEKQSIYSFQGANPARFGEVGRAVRQRARAIGVAFHDVPLTLSFRSVPAILEAVDHVFARDEAAQGLSFVEGAVITHHAHRTGEAGLVELWAPEAEAKAQPARAFEPWCEGPAGARSVDALCKRLAAQIDYWLKNGEMLVSQGRAVKAGDILILVRRRDPFTTPVIRELKRLAIPVAGADRMKLMDQLAVQDLVALADTLLMPEDDLALAVVLKSPLFGLDDEALFDLAYARNGSLWSALMARAAEDARFAEPAARLAAWLARADLSPPYEFFAELLGADDQLMRRRMLARLGPEAAEAIDEFLDRALDFDREAAPSLQGFVNHLRAGDVEIKRDMEQQRDEVRIMTVHGAKGLQAPIVFLPDTCMLPRAQGPRLYPLPRSGVPESEVAHIVWAAGRNDLDVLTDAKDAMRRGDIEEYHRLLYVAMTRASDRLYVCGWQGQKDKPEKNSWYELIAHGLDGHLVEAACHDGAKVRRMESAQAKPVEPDEVKKAAAAAAPLPDWASAPSPRERARPTLAPSRLALGTDGAAHSAEQPPAGPSALGANDRYARGRLVHALLQHLPNVAAEHQERAARAFVAIRGADLDQALRDEIVAETLNVVRNPDFAPLFRPGSLAEVPVVARLGEGDGAFALDGQIDRLAVLDRDLLIVDYKTNRPPAATAEEVAPAYIAQLAAYRAALERLFPGRTLRAALLWTDGPRLMEIPSALLDDAERRILQRAGEP